MAVLAGYSRHKMLDELNEPLYSSTKGGDTYFLTPLEQKTAVKVNAGLELANGALVKTMPAPQATASGATITLTPANITGGFLVMTPTAAQAATLPLADDLTAAIPDMQIGEAFELNIRNDAGTADFHVTMTTNTGWTLDPTSGIGLVIHAAPTPAAGESQYARFWIRKTAASAYTLHRVG